MRLKIRILALCVCFGLFSHGVSASDYRATPLKGMGKLYVMTNLNEEALKLGLNPGQLKGSVEEKLKAGGVALCEEKVSVRNPCLQVEVTVIGSSWWINVEALEMASISSRRPPFSGIVITWQTTAIGASATPARIASALSDGVGKFIHDYLKANPKK